jgi:hypothetical protein
MSTKVTLKNVVISYPNLFTPKQIMNSGDPKYSTAVLIAKNDKANLDKLNAAIEAEKKDDKLKGIPARKIDSPIMDGDEEKPDDKYYAGCYYINAKASENHPPKVVDRHVEPIMDQEEIYAGCICNVVVQAYAYNFNGHAGIGLGLGNIQKVKDGERMGGGSSAAEDDFADLGDDGEDFLN